LQLLYEFDYMRGDTESQKSIISSPFSFDESEDAPTQNTCSQQNQSFLQRDSIQYIHTVASHMSMQQHMLVAAHFPQTLKVYFMQAVNQDQQVTMSVKIYSE